MKQEFTCYAVVPPKEITEDPGDFPMNEALGFTQDKAWERFCHPSLNRAAYENDGFEAKKVKVTIEVL